MLGNSWVAAQLAASHEGHSSMELAHFHAVDEWTRRLPSSFIVFRILVPDIGGIQFCTSVYSYSRNQLISLLINSVHFHTCETASDFHSGCNAWTEPIEVSHMFTTSIRQSEDGTLISPWPHPTHEVQSIYEPSLLIRVQIISADAAATWYISMQKLNYFKFWWASLYLNINGWTIGIYLMQSLLFCVYW
jgi:hypothetical protein